MAIYIISAVFLLAALLKIQTVYKAWVFRKHGIEILATILKKEAVDAKWGIKKYQLHYAYDISGHIFKDKSEIGFKFFSEISLDDKLYIIYQKNKPKLSYLRSWYLENLSTQITLAFSFILAAILTPILF